MSDEQLRPHVGRPRRVADPFEAASTGAREGPPAAEAGDEPTKRRRRASVGEAALKLAAPGRPGFKRRWFNDDANRIAVADELAYDHVTETGVKTSSPGSRISRLVGTKANGEPLHAFLMETPDELYAEGVAEKEAHNRLVDDAIVAGRDSTGQMSTVPSTETYGQGSIQKDR